MTRETRIALLVGLLFIIMFGLVLTELTGKSALPDSEPLIVNANDGAYPWMPAAELRRPAADDAAAVSHGSWLDQPQQVDQDPSQQPVVDAYMRRLEAPPVEQNPPPQPVLAHQQGALRTYRIEPGDSPIKIARKVYGPSYEREYTRIMDANRDRIRDERSLKVGMEIVIPPLPASAGQGPAPQPRQASPARQAPGALADDGQFAYVPQSQGSTQMSLAQAVAQATARVERRSAARTYVVKRGDSLTSIARNILRDESRSAIERLFNANKDKLRSVNNLPVGLELTIPSGA